jgi:hypothetical protein
MPWVRFEPAIPAFEQSDTVHALDRMATVIGYHGQLGSVKQKIQVEYQNASRWSTSFYFMTCLWSYIACWAIFCCLILVTGGHCLSGSRKVNIFVFLPVDISPTFLRHECSAAITVIEHAGLRDNGPEFYSISAWFESLSKRQLYWRRFFVICLIAAKKLTGLYCRLAQDQFLPHSSKFVNQLHPTIQP